MPNGETARPLWNGAASLVLGLLMVAGGNVLFHLIAGHLLGPVEYGSLSALLTILLALSIPAGAVQVALTAEVTRIHVRGRRVDYVRTIGRFAATGLLIGAAMVLAGPALADYLHVEGVTAIVLVGLFFTPALVNLVLRSVLLGRGQHGALAAILVGGTALRVGVGWTALALWPSSEVALLVALVSEVVTAAVLWWAAWRRPELDRLGWELRLQVRDLIGGIAAFAGFWLVVGIDTVVARHQLSAGEAGMYAATVLAARTVLFAPQAIVTAAIPKYALDDGQAKRALVDSLVGCLLTGLLGVVAVVAAGGPILELLLGGSFDLSGPTLVYLCVASLWAAMLNALVNYHLARGSVARANASWIGAVGVLAAGHFVGAPTTLSLVVLISVVVSGGFAVLPLIRSEVAPTGPGPIGAPSLDLSVVVPVRRGDTTAVQMISDLENLLADDGLSFELIAVDDGLDDVASIGLGARRSSTTRVLRHAESLGRGACIRTGWSAARGGLLAYLDGDVGVDPTVVQELVLDARCFDACGVVGSIAADGHRQNTTRVRAWIGAVARSVLRQLVPVPVRDTQTGAKVFRRDMVADVLPLTREDGELLDLEFLTIANKRGWRHVIETPVVGRARRSTLRSAGALVWHIGPFLSLLARLHLGERETTPVAAPQVEWST